MSTEATEKSPLLIKNDSASVLPVSVLGELIGARHLNVDNKQQSVYATVKFGSKTVHRTKPVNDPNPIWSLRENPLFLLIISANDFSNNKNLVVTLYSGSRSLFAGKIRIKCADILNLCTEERVEMDLTDELGRAVFKSDRGNSKLALRFRMASAADSKFVQAWKQPPVTRESLKGTGILPQEHRKRAVLLTELDENKVAGATLRSAVSNSATRNRVRVRLKPGPDPQRPTVTDMSVDNFKACVNSPSRNWIEAGSGDLGRLEVEILSCHDLPNVDYGNAVGNETDAFCCAIYGDAMAQTCAIDDELSPHWPPWTERAFCFNILHPSQVLYLAVFGYKRGILFSHVPIGRVEINPINFQRDTVHFLEYSLFKDSHSVNRKASGKIRIRLRVQVPNERAALLAALKPCPALYLNVRKKKSWYVARYTAYGEYDNEEKFSLRVLLAYIDEIQNSFLRRIVYSINDAAQSLIFWRGQVKIFGIWVPLHSFLLFCAGIILVERPQVIPGFFFLGAGYLMLVNMYLRRQSPSPWYRCFSYWHYFCVLVLGRSPKHFEKVEPDQGWEEQKEIEDARRKRAEDDDRFFQKKEAVEKEIEVIESISVQTESKAAIVSLEVLVILGQLQGIVGHFVRLCRSIDAVITWEESDLAFWICSAFLVTGVLFLFFPWAFLLKWMSRLAVVLFLGPQNKLIDMFLVRNDSDEQKLRQLFELRMFRARCFQEQASQLRSFRHVLYGKHSIAVPSIQWTPHLDHPRPESSAYYMSREAGRGGLESTEGLPYIPGQKLYGLMVPRPRDEWTRNEDESKEDKRRVTAAVWELYKNPQATQTSFASYEDEPTEEEEGVEVSDMYDIEADLAGPDKQRLSENSLRVDRGVEVGELDDEAQFVQKSWRGSSSQNFLKEDLLGLSGSDDDGSFQKKAVPSTTSREPVLDGPDKQRISENSLRVDGGVEVAELDDEARFVQKSWRGSSSQNFPKEDLLGLSGSDDDGSFQEEAAPSTTSREPALTFQTNEIAREPGRVLTIQAQPGASQRELGVEALYTFDDDDDDSVLVEDQVAEDSSVEDLEGMVNLSTVEAEPGASLRELGMEIVPDDQKRI